MPYATSSHFAYHKTKWSTSLRSRHIVDLALSESDQSLRSPGPARIPSPAIPDRSSAQPSPSSSTSSPQFKRPKTVNVPDFNQPKNQAQADSEWGVSTDVEECTSGTKKLLMELGINKLGEAREILYVIEIEDTEHDIMSQVSNLVAPFLASTIQPASTHQVITFPDVHVSADEDMPSSSRTFRVSSPTEALLDPESGSSYDDSEFSDDDDAEYLVTSAKKEIQQNLSDDEELPPQVRKKNNNEENVDDCDERAEAGRGRVKSRGLKHRHKSKKLMSNPPAISDTAPNPNIMTKALTGKTTKIVLNLLEGLEHKGHCVTMDNYYNSPALARYLKCRGFDCLGTERLTRKNIPEDVKEMKKNCEKGTIIACHPAM
ncbi:PiggyBac transposable element-derived protein 4 [Eumeta japonica]|uniref:PiggyBac transposable element-derived protein 4 n=1 Tax=Eumeta variegata TaxID=151549 RepID=A0A4C1W002_EUMVA|nr:PiggyBac transposable element-derived protein 4 [Eumeta japonica]